ncbi:hypothetical protein SDC9_123380 [bioreactor metagenome]|uniref:alpha-L-rhamnosidase n=1 Tax=bioreactor metagenome TaxID=1076179 RepID=A0A645CHM0_9ZZZZ
MYDTGIFGTDIVTRILFEHGYGELAYSLLTSKKEISFNTIIERGGTTLWEYWTGKRSYSHPMFGAVVKYLFKYLLGINQPVESNGFSSIIISPIIINELTSISGSIMTPKGQVTVSITQDSSEVTVRTDVPEKANAKLVLYGTEYPLCAGRNEITAQIQ